MCFVSAETGVGIRQLLTIFERLMPNPTEANPPVFLKGEGDDAKEVKVVPDADAHAIAHVFMVNIDTFKGRLAFFRIHQGTINAGNQLYVGDARKPFKATQLLKVNGDNHDKIEVAVPGDICALPRVDEAHYDAVLHDSHDEDHFHLKPVKLPRPMFGLAIRAQDDKDAQNVKRSRPRPRATTATRSRPAARASSARCTSASSRCRRGKASSSAAKWSAGRFRAASSRPSKTA